MKRLFLGVLAGVLVSCGSLDTAPTTGQLLGAPTSLNLMGGAVRAQTVPTLKGETFSVRLTLQASSPRKTTLPPLLVTDLYVVTADGVWSTPVRARPLQRCGVQCGLTTVSAPARGMQRGTGVQVVVGLRDGQGRPYLLRDQAVRVK